MTSHIPSRVADTLSSLLASARRITETTFRQVAPERWQDEAWELYDKVGELRFVANAHANAVSQARWFAAKVGDRSDEPTPVVLDDPDVTPSDTDVLAARIVSELAGGPTGLAETVRRLALHLFVSGDGWIVGVPPGSVEMRAPTVDVFPDEFSLADLEWHSMSTDEVSVRAENVIIELGDNTRRRIPHDRCVAIRVWRPHPRRWWQADSPTRSSLPVLRELVGLTKHVSAEIDSRLAGNGILVVGQSVQVAGRARDPDTGAETEIDVVDALIDAMSTAIADRQSASALVPLVLKLPDEAVDKVQHITFDRGFDGHAMKLRDEAIRRLALSVDAPAEQLLGLGSANHWGAWLIEESAVRTFIRPVLTLMADAFSAQYLWEALENEGVPREEARRYVVWYSTSALTVQPDRSGDAWQVYQAGELSGAALRRESGFDHDDAPDRPDRAVELVLQMVARAPSLAANPGMTELVEAVRTVLDGSEPDGNVIDTSDVDATSGGLLPDTAGDPPPSGPDV